MRLRWLLALAAAAALVVGGVAIASQSSPSATVIAVPEASAGEPEVEQAQVAQAPDAISRLSDKKLAARVIFGCVDSNNYSAQRGMAKRGFGGIVLLGASPPSDLKSRLASIQRAAKEHQPVIASDEEGGVVQRLGSLLGDLPSAETMGTWSDSRLRRTAAAYGAKMARLGVGMSLAPVADLRVPGSYLDRDNRAFSTDPATVGRKVVAWSQGLQRAGVVPVVKHWPGHGHAANTHVTAATVPPLSQLRRADLVPFGYAVDKGVDVVMVAHVQSKGLTRSGEPATQSRKAMRKLRKQLGDDVVVVTDSLSMAAASSARGLSPAQAAVKSLKAGVEWAMVCSDNYSSVHAAVRSGLRSGSLDREALEASARRIDTVLARS